MLYINNYIKSCYQNHSFQKGECTMSQDINVRWGWLKAMYIYTIVGA
jgi:hypothetical protein